MKMRYFAFSAIILSICFLVVHQLLASNLPIVCNRGIAGGFFVNNFIIFLALVALILIFRYCKQAESNFASFCFTVLIAGGIVNVLDRIFFGCVRDYFSFFSFSVFNLPDTVIVFGAILILSSYAKQSTFRSSLRS